MGHNVGGARTAVDRRAHQQDMPSPTMFPIGVDGGNAAYVNAMQQQLQQQFAMLGVRGGAGMLPQQQQQQQHNQQQQQRAMQAQTPLGGYWGNAMGVNMAQLAAHKAAQAQAQGQQLGTPPGIGILTPQQQLSQQQFAALNGLPQPMSSMKAGMPQSVNRSLILPVPQLLEKIDRAAERLGGLNPLAAIVGDIQTWGITVTDPLEKRKVACPTSKIGLTNGLLDSSNKAHTHSICILYQNYKCKVDQNCNQIHVDRQFYAEQRKGTPCCAEHHDLFTQVLLSQQVVVLPRIILVATQKGNRTPYMWPTNYVSLSLGLSRCDVRIIDGVETIIVEDNRVCQVWQNSRCTYGKECNYVHLCRGLYDLIPRDVQHRAIRTNSTRNASTGPSLSSTPSARIPIVSNGSVALTSMMSTGSNSSLNSSCVLGGTTPPSGSSHLTQLTPPTTQPLNPPLFGGDNANAWMSLSSFPGASAPATQQLGSGAVSVASTGGDPTDNAFQAESIAAALQARAVQQAQGADAGARRASGETAPIPMALLANFAKMFGEAGPGRRLSGSTPTQQLVDAAEAAEVVTRDGTPDHQDLPPLGASELTPR